MLNEEQTISEYFFGNAFFADRLFCDLSLQTGQFLTSIKQKKTALLKGISTKLGEDTRVKFVDSDKGDDKVVFWLVPAGADNPVP